MWIHPNSIGHNFVIQFPEIFTKYEPIRFQLQGDRMADFFESASFLFGSKTNNDINMVFSAVQRLLGSKYEDFQSYIKNPKIYKQLLDVNNTKDLRKIINNICEDYNSKFGMNRKIKDFYKKYLTNEEKQSINSKLYKPASYKPERGLTTEDGFEMSLDVLLYKRNKLDHSAQYIPFHNSQAIDFTRIKIKDGNKEVEWFSKLTFEDFYEITRKAVSKFWLEEYETYLNNGGKELIDKLVDEVTKRCEELNKISKKA